MNALISVEEAESIILENKISIGTEKVAIEDAWDRVLAEDLRADRDFPPFDRVTMDGIAIKYQQFEEGQTEFHIEAIAAAGNTQKTLEDTAKCMEVMTGAMLPVNTDTIIRYEDLLIKDKVAKVTIAPLSAGMNVHTKGSDRKENDIIVAKGSRLSAAEIGVAATIGKSEVLVQRTLRAVIISTGEEIVSVNEIPLAHQIRTSNGYALQASLKRWGVKADNVLLPDDQLIIEQKIAEFLTAYDVLILSGGVSAGKFDFVPKALENQGVKKLFHKVSQRPGKPFWFGIAPHYEGYRAVFALPGNPVSTFMCLHRYFKLWLDASQGIEGQKLMAELTEDFIFKPDLTFFLQVKLVYSPMGKVLAYPIEGHGSGDLANLVEADAFIELPMGRDLFNKGEVFKVFSYRQMK